MIPCLRMSLLFGLSILFAPTAWSQQNDLPGDFKQILPRGAIAAINNPEFVSADEAEISDEAWVLGVLIAGQARAYSLNILNHHEVVNDQVGEKAFAAVW